MNVIRCYLVREDKQFYNLGTQHTWRSTFAVFPGPIDGSVTLLEKDIPVLALRLADRGVDDDLNALARDIVTWAAGKSFRFVTDLEPEITPGVEPEPITGSRYDFGNTVAPGGR